LEQSIQESKYRAECHDFYAACLKDSNKLIGNLYLGKRDFDSCEIGYVFNKNYKGKGFATEDAMGLIQYAFDEIGAKRIIAECNPENEHSWKMLECLGLRREGHLIKNIYFKMDENEKPFWQDTYIYGVQKVNENFKSRILIIIYQYYGNYEHMKNCANL
jgi:ribosomal-protein-alanine N-acetyltransferase